MQPFYQNLKAWRLFKGLTQEELARGSGISRPNVAALERGRRECTISTLNRLSYALGVTPGTLLDKRPLLGNSDLLGRHQVDQIARNLIAGKGDLHPSLLAIRDQAAQEAGPLLRATGILRKRRIKRRSSSANKEEVGKVLVRVAKLLPHFLSEEAP